MNETEVALLHGIALGFIVSLLVLGFYEPVRDWAMTLYYWSIEMCNHGYP